MRKTTKQRNVVRKPHVEGSGNDTEYWIVRYGEGSHREHRKEGVKNCCGCSGINTSFQRACTVYDRWEEKYPEAKNLRIEQEWAAMFL